MALVDPRLVRRRQTGARLSLPSRRLESEDESLAIPEGEEPVLKAQVDVDLFELPFVVQVCAVAVGVKSHAAFRTVERQWLA